MSRMPRDPAQSGDSRRPVLPWNCTRAVSSLSSLRDSTWKTPADPEWIGGNPGDSKRRNKTWAALTGFAKWHQEEYPEMRPREIGSAGVKTPCCAALIPGSIGTFGAARAGDSHHPISRHRTADAPGYNGASGAGFPPPSYTVLTKVESREGPLPSVCTGTRYLSRH